MPIPLTKLYNKNLFIMIEEDGFESQYEKLNEKNKKITYLSLSVILFIIVYYVFCSSI